MPYTHVAICRLGDVVSRDVSQEPAPPRCPRCGVAVFTACVNCNLPLRGPEYELVQGYEPMTLVRLYSGEYVPPLRCARCRTTHPWAKIVRALHARDRDAA